MKREQLPDGYIEYEHGWKYHDLRPDIVKTADKVRRIVEASEGNVRYHITTMVPVTIPQRMDTEFFERTTPTRLA